VYHYKFGSFPISSNVEEGLVVYGFVARRKDVRAPHLPYINIYLKFFMNPIKFKNSQISQIKMQEWYKSKNLQSLNVIRSYDLYNFTLNCKDISRNIHHLNSKIHSPAK